MTNTTTVEALYDDHYSGNATGDYFIGPYDYKPMLQSFGDVVLQVHQDDYQGDSWVLYHRDGLYGFLTFGWGSCTVCDALQACDSWEEVEELRQQLEDKIVWGTAEEVRDYLASENHEGEWYFGEYEWGQFRDAAIERLSAG